MTDKAIEAAYQAVKEYWTYFPCDKEEWLECITKAIQAYEAAKWQPIETCPKQGKILAYWPAVLLDEDGLQTSTPADVEGFIGVASWDGGYFSEPETLNAVGDYFGDDWEYSSQPTHWQLLPQPPREGE